GVAGESNSDAVELFDDVFRWGLGFSCHVPLLSTLWSLHHLVGARRQVQYVFRVRFREVSEQVAQADDTDQLVSGKHGKRAVVMLLHRCNGIGDGLAGADGLWF